MSVLFLRPLSSTSSLAACTIVHPDIISFLLYRYRYRYLVARAMRSSATAAPISESGIEWDDPPMLKQHSRGRSIYVRVRGTPCHEDACRQLSRCEYRDLLSIRPTDCLALAIAPIVRKKMQPPMKGGHWTLITLCPQLHYSKNFYLPAFSL